ncbi:MAG: hypothetical protein IT368_16165 [Candidatus Hydrogenedentes bacterium]|nr:hypothetical protein [Candidatus Hydrogenedentota bacterium]
MKLTKNFLVVFVALGLVTGMSTLMIGCPDSDDIDSIDDLDDLDEVDDFDDIGAAPATPTPFPSAEFPLG